MTVANPKQIVNDVAEMCPLLKVNKIGSVTESLEAYELGSMTVGHHGVPFHWGG